MPHFVILIHGGSGDPSPADLAAHDVHAQDLIGSGALVAAFAFGPTDGAVRIDAGGPASRAPGAAALDGIGVVEADDIDAAVAIARANPAIVQGGFVEVRPVLGSWVRGGGSGGPDASDGSAHGVPSTS
ncbi:YciI family protein [Curtobacterium luteum]|uniref:YciI family protein n=1 Tax=Curtobacterium luteum TaxID=33881 RepID=UPI0007366DA5|nr:YciI family protein [Curtobacterium luteum]